MTTTDDQSIREIAEKCFVELESRGIVSLCEEQDEEYKKIITKHFDEATKPLRERLEKSERELAEIKKCKHQIEDGELVPGFTHEVAAESRLQRIRELLDERDTLKREKDQAEAACAVKDGVLKNCEIVLDVLYTFHRHSEIWNQFKMTSIRDAAKAALTPSIRAEVLKECVWTIDDNSGSYDTTCDNKFEFTNDGINENGFRHCPYCGLKIRAAVSQPAAAQTERPV